MPFRPKIVSIYSMGGKSWIESLIQTQSQGLIRYSLSIIKDRELAKDIVQDCFLKLLQQDQDEIRPRAQTWLYRECRNRSIDLWRRNKKSEPLADNFDDQIAEQRHDALSKIETRQDGLRLLHQLSQLSQREQEVVRLKYSDGLSYQQIAEVMNLTTSNVGFILCQALRTLRELESKPETKKQQYGE